MCLFSIISIIALKKFVWIKLPFCLLVVLYSIITSIYHLQNSMENCHETYRNLDGSHYIMSISFATAIAFYILSIMVDNWLIKMCVLFLSSEILYIVVIGFLKTMSYFTLHVFLIMGCIWHYYEEKNNRL